MSEEINLDFVKPNKDCNTCDHHNFYTCFECEWIQVKDKYNDNFRLSEWKNNEDIIKFLNINFNPKGELYNYADYTLNNSIVYKIENKESNEIVGCISVCPMKFLIKGESKIIFYVDHLNIKEEYRNKSLAADLISFVVDNIGDQIYLFKKDISPLPFKYFCKYRYFLILDKEKGNILPEVVENIDIKKEDYKIFTEPYKNSIILERDNKKAIIYYTNILDKNRKEIFEIGYVEDKYIGQLAINYIRHNYPESQIIVNNLGGTNLYFRTRYLSDNYLYFFNYRLKEQTIHPRNIFIACP